MAFDIAPRGNTGVLPDVGTNDGWMGDVGRAAASTVLGTGAGLASLGGSAIKGFAKSAMPGMTPEQENEFDRINPANPVEDALSAAREEVLASMSPRNKAALEAGAFPGEGQQSLFHDFGRSVLMKGAAAAPYLAGGYAAGASKAAAAGSSLAFGADATFGNRAAVRQKVMTAPTDTLMETNPMYRDARATGMSDYEARKGLIESELTPGAEALTFATNTLFGASVASAFRGLPSLGRTARGAIGGTEAAVGMGAQSGVDEYNRQKAEVAQGVRTTIDRTAILRAGGSGAVEGFGMGAPLGAYHKTQPKEVAVDPTLAAGARGSTEQDWHAGVKRWGEKYRPTIGERFPDATTSDPLREGPDARVPIDKYNYEPEEGLGIAPRPVETPELRYPDYAPPGSSSTGGGRLSNTDDDFSLSPLQPQFRAGLPGLPLAPAPTLEGMRERFAPSAAPPPAPPPPPPDPRRGIPGLPLAGAPTLEGMRQRLAPSAVPEQHGPPNQPRGSEFAGVPDMRRYEDMTDERGNPIPQGDWNGLREHADQAEGPSPGGIVPVDHYNLPTEPITPWRPGGYPSQGRIADRLTGTLRGRRGPPEGGGPRGGGGGPRGGGTPPTGGETAMQRAFREAREKAEAKGRPVVPETTAEPPVQRHYDEPLTQAEVDAGEIHHGGPMMLGGEAEGQAPKAQFPKFAKAISTITLGKKVPPIKAGHTRLYRAEGTPNPKNPTPDWVTEAQRDNGHAAAQGRWFTADHDALEWYRDNVGHGAHIVYVDVPNNMVERYRVSNIKRSIGGEQSVQSFSRDPGNEFFVTKKLGESRKPIETGRRFSAPEAQRKPGQHGPATLADVLERTAQIPGERPPSPFQTLKLTVEGAPRGERPGTATKPRAVAGGVEPTKGEAPTGDRRAAKLPELTREQEMENKRTAARAERAEREEATDSLYNTAEQLRTMGQKPVDARDEAALQAERDRVKRGEEAAKEEGKKQTHTEQERERTARNRKEANSAAATLLEEAEKLPGINVLTGKKRNLADVTLDPAKRRTEGDAHDDRIYANRDRWIKEVRLILEEAKNRLGLKILPSRLTVSRADRAAGLMVPHQALAKIAIMQNFINRVEKFERIGRDNPMQQKKYIDDTFKNFVDRMSLFDLSHEAKQAALKRLAEDAMSEDSLNQFEQRVVQLNKDYSAARVAGDKREIGRLRELLDAFTDQLPIVMSSTTQHRQVFGDEKKASGVGGLYESGRRAGRPRTAESKKAPAAHAVGSPEAHAQFWDHDHDGTTASGIGYVLHTLGHYLDRVKSTQVRELMQNMHELYSRFLADPTIAKIRMRVLPDAEFERLHPEATGIMGYYPEGKLVGNERGVIDLAESAAKGPNGGYITMHEVAHAATVHAIENNSRLRRNIGEAGLEVQRELHYNPDLLKQFGFDDYLQSRVDEWHDPFEFIADFNAMPQLQALLLNMPVPAAFAKRWGVKPSESFLIAIAKKIGRALGFDPRHQTMFEALTILNEEAIGFRPIRLHDVDARDIDAAYEEKARDRERGVQTRPSRVVPETTTRNSLTEKAIEIAKSARDSLPDSPRRSALDWAKKLLVKASQNTTLGEISRGLFHAIDGSGNTRVDLLNRHLGEMSTTKNDIIREVDRPLVERSRVLERQHQASGMWGKFEDLMLDETMANVFSDRPIADQKHLTKMERWQAEAQFRKLEPRWAELPEDLQALRKDLHKYFDQRQAQMALRTAINIIRSLGRKAGKPDALSESEVRDMAEKFIVGALTAEQQKALHGGNVMKAIRDARALARILGPYIPLMRRGNYVVSGEYQYDAPDGGRRVDSYGKPTEDHTWRFSDEAKAQKFASESDLKILEPKEIYTRDGSRFVTEMVNGKAEERKLTKRDWTAGNAEREFVLKVQPKHLEFFHSKREMERRHGELERATKGIDSDGHEMEPLRLKLEGYQEKEWTPDQLAGSFMSKQWRDALTALEGSDGFKTMGRGSQDVMRRQLIELGIASLGSNRIQTSRLPRRYVSGASSDILANLGHYGVHSAGYLARMKHMPDIDRAMTDLQEEERSRHYEKSEMTYMRSMIVNELGKRVTGVQEPEREGLFHDVQARMLQLSYIDKLMSPAYHMINAMEPWMVALPVIAGRHGRLETLAEMRRATEMIGGLRDTAMMGFRDMQKAFRENIGFTDFAKTYRDRIEASGHPNAARLVEMVDMLVKRGAMSPEAGQEMERLTGGSVKGPMGLLGSALDRADLMNRTMSIAIEQANRAVTGITAYNREFAKTGDHDKAMQYTYDKVVQTMGDYSPWNQPTAFNNSNLKWALQFKKYGLKTYQMLASNALNSFDKNLTPAQRKEARATLLNLMGSHAMMAGTLGLPLEPIKIAMLLTSAVGLTGGYDEAEAAYRSKMTELFGKDLGEIISRGVPRYFGVDMGRVGLDNLLTPQGNPRSNSKADLMLYAAQAFAGAPGSLVTEWPSAFTDMWNGNVGAAAGKIIPLKGVADMVKSAQRMMYGQVSPGGRQTQPPYTLGEGIVQALGFTPGATAETSEHRARLQADLRRERTSHTELTSDWLQATGSARDRAWRAIERDNRGKPVEAQITLGELHRMEARRAKEERGADTVYGIRLNKRNRYLGQQSDVYGVQE